MAYGYYSPGSRLLYLGDEAAYQRFINLAVIQNLEPRERAVIETVPNDPEFWTLWSSSPGRRLISCGSLPGRSPLAPLHRARPDRSLARD